MNGKDSINVAFLSTSFDKCQLTNRDLCGMPFLPARCISVEEFNCTFTILSSLPSLESLSMVVLG